MKNQKRLLSCLASSVAAIVLVAISMSFSSVQGQAEEGANQNQGQSQDGDPYGGGGFGFGFGGGSGGGGGGTFPADFIGGSPAIAVDSKHVFVVHNNTLYKFASDDLTTIKSVPLEAVD